MLTDQQTFAYAYFGDPSAAQRAVQGLIAAEFDTEHIGVIVRRGDDAEDVPLEHKTGLGRGAFLGSIVGAAAGAAALPAAGVIAVSGAAATVGGGAVGGALGTLMGALGGLGLWRDEHAAPGSAFANGGVLIGALTSPERAERARAALRAAGAPEPKLATPAEAKRELVASPLPEAPRRGAPVDPEKLARNVFLLTLAYVAAVGVVIWLFIRPV